jgi:hypothetical protein
MDELVYPKTANFGGIAGLPSSEARLREAARKDGDTMK